MIVNEETVVSILKTVKYLCKWLSTKNLSGCLAVQPPTQDVPGRNIIIATLPKIILTLVLWVDYISTTHFPSGRLSGTIKVSTTATGPHLEGWLPGNMLHLFLVVLFLSFQVWPSSKNTEHATVITSYRDNHLQWLPSTYSDYHLQWLPPTYLYLNRSRSERPRDTEAQKTGPVCRHKKCSHYRGCLGHV